MTDILNVPLPPEDSIAYERLTGVVNVIRGHVIAARWFELLMSTTNRAEQARIGREGAEDMLRTVLRIAGAEVEDA